MRKSIIRLATTDGDGTPVQAKAAILRELAERLDRPNSFAKGQIIAASRTGCFPTMASLAIVTAVLPTPVFDLTETSSASPYFQGALTLVLGITKVHARPAFR